MFAGQTPRPLYHRALSGPCCFAYNTTLSSRPHLGKSPLILTPAILESPSIAKLLIPICNIQFPLYTCCSQRVFYKPLVVPPCLHTCSQGQARPALLSLLSPVPHIPGHSVRSGAGCTPDLQQAKGPSTGRGRREGRVQTLPSTAKDAEAQGGEPASQHAQGPELGVWMGPRTWAPRLGRICTPHTALRAGGGPGRKICLGERDGLCFVLFLWCFHNFGEDIFKPEHGAVPFSLPILAPSSGPGRRAARSPDRSPVTAPPAGPRAKSTPAAKDKHGQVRGTPAREG